MGSSSRRRLLGCLLFAAIGSACAGIMGVDEASLREPDASSPDGGVSTSDGSAPAPQGSVGTDACAGEGCSCTDDSECRNEPYRKCVAGKCAECTADPDSCPLGRYCEVTKDGGAGSNRCTLGCKSHADCETLSPAAPLCHPDRRQCVECIGDEQCTGTNKQCSPSGTCADKCTGDGGTCPMPNETCCAGICVDLSTDIFNCNACGATCGGGTPVCCSGQCKDSQVDPSNCGGCSKTCKVAAGTPVCAGGACLPATCADVLANTPGAPSGVYVVDPDGSGGASSFSVYCDMTTDGGGWTLVGREVPGITGTFRFLAAETQNPSGLAAGESGLLGKRFSGKYTRVWIAWANDRYIRFTVPDNFDFFANTVQPNVNLQQVTTNDPALNNWFRDGAKACIASRLSDVRPGDTSWAIKPRNDNHTSCGCNDGSWVGRGAYYGGTLPPNHTACDGWGGGWAGARDNGQQKGGIGPEYETRIYVK